MIENMGSESDQCEDLKDKALANDDENENLKNKRETLKMDLRALRRSKES